MIVPPPHTPGSPAAYSNLAKFVMAFVIVVCVLVLLGLANLLPPTQIPAQAVDDAVDNDDTGDTGYTRHACIACEVS